MLVLDIILFTLSIMTIFMGFAKVKLFFQELKSHS